MSFVALNHSRQRLQSNVHGRNSVDVYCALYVSCSLLVESLVTCDNTRAVDDDIHVATLLTCLFKALDHSLGVRNVHLVTLDVTLAYKFCASTLDALLINIPYNQLARASLQSHVAHYATYARRTTGDKNAISFNFSHFLMLLVFLRREGRLKSPKQQKYFAQLMQLCAKNVKIPCVG
jgi:hypothetical protein